MVYTGVAIENMNLVKKVPRRAMSPIPTEFPANKAGVRFHPPHFPKAGLVYESTLAVRWLHAATRAYTRVCISESLVKARG
jgi:hypothetical protein